MPVNDIFGTIASCVASNAGAYIVSLLILIGGIWGWFSFNRRLKPILAGVEKAIILVRNQQTPEDFSATFETLDVEMRKNPVLASGWIGLTRFLIFPRADQSPRFIRLSHPPEYFFNFSAITEGQINLDRYRAITNYLTGAGILGTFVGLVAGIYLAEQGLASADVKNVSLALGSLLKGASLAFLTSVAGLITSLPYSFLKKGALHRLEQRIQTFAGLILERLPLVTQETILNDVLHEQRSQTAQLEVFNSDLGVSIAGALDEKLAGRLGPSIEKLLHAVEALRTDRAEVSENVLSGVVSQFKETLSGSMGKEMQVLAQTLQQLDVSLQGTIARISSSHDEINRSTNGIAEVIKASMNESGESLVRFLKTSIQDLGAQMGAAGKASAEDIRNSGAVAAQQMEQRLGPILEALQRSSQTMDSWLEKVQQSSSKMADDMAERVRSTGERFQGEMASSLEAIRGTFNEAMNESSGSLREAGKVAAERLREASSRFSDQIEGFGKVTERVQQLVVATGEVLAKVSNLGATIEAGHKAFQGTAQPLKDCSEATAKASENVSQALGSMKELSDRVAEMSRTFTGTFQESRKIWEEYEVRFQNLDNTLRSAFSELVDGLQNYSDKVREFHVNMDASMGKAVSHLSSVIQELEETVGDMSEVLEKTKK